MWSCRLYKKKRDEGKERYMKKQKLKSPAIFFFLFTLKVTNVLGVFWLASLLITGDIYFDNYSLERFLFK